MQQPKMLPRHSLKSKFDEATKGIIFFYEFFVHVCFADVSVLVFAIIAIDRFYVAPFYAP